MLILDPHLLSGRDDVVSDVLDFLRALDRPIRALTRISSHPLLASLPTLRVRQVPQPLHDRVWLVGEAGLLVGTSINGFLDRGNPDMKATTAAELPFADAALWRMKFEEWWGAGSISG